MLKALKTTQYYIVNIKHKIYHDIKHNVKQQK